MTSPNNFDLLRFSFAAVVFLYHAHVLSGRDEFVLFSRWLSADLAVKAFFVVSGYLVSLSLARSRSLTDYAWKRVRRVYPAYAAVVIACAVGGVLLTTWPPELYFGAEWGRYLAANLAFLNFLAPGLPGVFQQNPTSVVNGALWSLKVEVGFYVVLPIVAWLASRGGRWTWLTLCYTLSVAWAFTMQQYAEESGRGVFVQLGLQLPGQLRYFVIGIAAFHAAPRWSWRRWVWAVPACVAAILVPLPPSVDLAVEPAALGVLVLVAAFVVPYLGNFGRYGDFSYGIYITHFPVLQAIVAAGLFERHPYGALALSTLVVAMAAVVSWHLVEKPFLRASSHYVAATRGPSSF